jgi:hypothetical protein
VRGGDKKESNRRVNMIEVHYMHVWECHNETPYFVQLIYTNKNYDVSWVRWHISVIPALVGLRQEERVRGQPGLHNETLSQKRKEYYNVAKVLYLVDILFLTF